MLAAVTHKVDPKTKRVELTWATPAGLAQGGLTLTPEAALLVRDALTAALDELGAIPALELGPYPVKAS